MSQGPAIRSVASPRRLIVNADDFGRSAAINAAVLQAHREGILTTASLMVNEEGFDQAVALARAHPRLGVGLHLSLLCGRSALPPAQIPDLVDSAGRFDSDPVRVGLRYFLRRRTLRAQLQAELEAQFDKFRRTGLPLDHVNGHLHLHLHPTVFGILMEHAARWGLTHLRWTRDPLWLNLRLARGRWLYRLSHALIFQGLSGRARPALRRRNIRHTPTVIGLLQDGRLDEDFLLRLLPRLPAGETELYSHPAGGRFQHELQALISPRVRALVDRLGLELIRYRDL